MLNSDMSFSKNIFDGAAQEGGNATCSFDQCTEALTGATVRAYAANNSLFVTEFGPVFGRLLVKGYNPCLLAVVPSKGYGAAAEASHRVGKFWATCEAAGFSPPGFLAFMTADSGGVAIPPAAGPGETPDDVRCFNLSEWDGPVSTRRLQKGCDTSGSATAEPALGPASGNSPPSPGAEMPSAEIPSAEGPAKSTPGSANTDSGSAPVPSVPAKGNGALGVSLTATAASVILIGLLSW
jgi:hypothetical protein